MSMLGDERYSDKPTTNPDPLNKQVGGSHYMQMKIQPVEFISMLVDGQHIGYHVSQAIKYLARYRRKNGKEDLDKATHYIEMAIAKEYSGE